MANAEPSLQLASQISVAALADYLSSTGWTAMPTRSRDTNAFFKAVPGADAPIYILLPSKPSFDNEQWRIADALRALEIIEERPMQEIADDIKRGSRTSRSQKSVWFINRMVGKAPRERKTQRSVSAPAVRQDQNRMYFVDFRARTAASYGHAFTWYGRIDQKEVEVAGLHPASDSIIPYILGHAVPVPSETGASYGDLDEKYVTASYRVLMDEAQAARVFAYIKHLQATSPFWHAVTYNCVAFIQNIARTMGLQVPGNQLLFPEKWVAQLRELNGGGEIGRMPSLANWPIVSKA
jgi:hypothetical protein